MRLLIITAAIAALTLPAVAQQQQPQQRPQQGQPQQRPQQQQPQQRPQQAPPPQAQQQPPAPVPGMFACRTEPEICYVGIVIGSNLVSVLYTNDPKGEGIDEKPVTVLAPTGAPADLSQHNGKVVMLTGEYSAQSGLSKAEVVDVAGPLLSFAIKSMLSGGGDEEEPEPEPPPQKPQPRQQQRR
jgi:hypothetical protein